MFSTFPAASVDLKEHLPWLLHLLLLSDCATSAVEQGSLNAAEAAAESSHGSASGNDESATDQRSASTACHRFGVAVAAAPQVDQGSCWGAAAQLPSDSSGQRRDSMGYSLLSTSRPDLEVASCLVFPS